MPQRNPDSQEQGRIVATIAALGLGRMEKPRERSRPNAVVGRVMPASVRILLLAIIITECVACATGGTDGAPDASANASDATIRDASAMPADAAAPIADGPLFAIDAGAACSVSGAPGQCIDIADCAALGHHTAFPGHCPGPADVQCCVVTPDVSDNPPVPTGYRPLMQSEVTPDMTAWAVAILNDSSTYPMFATATMTFGALTVLARVEWHPPDFQNGEVHRGVTLYTPL
jgi:hypothetical protein